MANSGGGQSLLSKPSDKLRIVADEIGQNDLDRKLCFQECVPGLVNNSHSALSDAAFEMVFALQNRRSGDGMHGRHPVIRTGSDIITETVFTELAFLHLGFVFDQTVTVIYVDEKQMFRRAQLYV